MSEQREPKVGDVWRRKSAPTGAYEYTVTAVSDVAVKVSMPYGGRRFWKSEFLRDFDFVREDSDNG